MEAQVQAEEEVHVHTLQAEVHLAVQEAVQAVGVHLAVRAIEDRQEDLAADRGIIRHRDQCMDRWEDRDMDRWEGRDTDQDHQDHQDHQDRRDHQDALIMEAAAEEADVPVFLHV